MNKIKHILFRHKSQRLIALATFAVLIAVVAGFTLLVSGAPGSPKSQKGQIEQAEKMPGSFVPYRQERISAETDAFTVSLAGIEPCDECGGSSSFSFVVKHKLKDTSTRFTIQNETAQIDSIKVVNESRAVVFGTVSGTMRSINIVNTDTGALEDYFLCNFPELSMDGRFLAYVKAAPRFSTAQEWSYVYLVYDLEATPTQNRVSAKDTSEQGIDNKIQVGVPVYPTANLKRKVYTTSSSREESQAHLLASERLLWIQGSQLAFVDRWNRVNRLVVVDLSMGLNSPQVSVKGLDTAAIVDGPVCKESRNALENLIIVTDISMSKEDRREFVLTLKPGPCLKRSTLDITLD